jgi:hypothetical protein
MGRGSFVQTVTKGKKIDLLKYSKTEIQELSKLADTYIGLTHM